MSYLITMIHLDADAVASGRSSIEVPTDIEALRIAQEGVAIAQERGRSVTYTVHDGEGRLIVSYTSTAAEV